LLQTWPNYFVPRRGISNSKLERPKRCYDSGRHEYVASRGSKSLIIQRQARYCDPPLVLTSILVADTMNAAHLIPVLSGKLFQEFNRSSPTGKACTLLRPVIEYLWRVHKNLIHPVVFSLDRSTDSKEWANRLHFANITPLAPRVLPPPFPLPPPPQAPAENRSAWDLIAVDIRIIRDATERQQLREVTAEDAKKDHSRGWEKNPELEQQMMLKLSAMLDKNLPPPRVRHTFKC